VGGGVAAAKELGCEGCPAEEDGRIPKMNA